MQNIMSKEVRDKAIIFGVIFTLVLIVFISLRSRDNKIERLQNEVFELRQQQDTLYQSNKAFIEATKQSLKQIDSIYNLSQQSNEGKIIDKWDSVYNSIISNPNTEQFANYLRELATKR